MEELSDTKLTLLEGFAYLTSLAYFENPSSCSYSVVETFSCAFSFHALLFLVYIAKHFKEEFPRLEVLFMPFQKGQLKNSLARLNMGPKSDIEQMV